MYTCDHVFHKCDQCDKSIEAVGKEHSFQYYENIKKREPSNNLTKLLGKSKQKSNPPDLGNKGHLFQYYEIHKKETLQLIHEHASTWTARIYLDRKGA